MHKIGFLFFSIKLNVVSNVYSDIRCPFSLFFLHQMRNDKCIVRREAKEFFLSDAYYFGDYIVMLL